MHIFDIPLTILKKQMTNLGDLGSLCGYWQFSAGRVIATTGPRFPAAKYGPPHDPRDRLGGIQHRQRLR